MNWFGTPPEAASGARSRVKRSCSLGILLLMAAAPAGLHAQVSPVARNPYSDPQRVAMARALFEEGLRHVDAQQWTLAADRFDRVLQLRYSAVAAYNLALSRARLGRCVEALEGLRELLAQPGLESAVRDAAASLLREEEAKVAWLTLRVFGACDGCSVQMDKRPWPSAALGVPVPVDPGRHVIRLTRNGSLVASAQLEAARGQRLQMHLDSVAGVKTQPSGAATSSAAAPTQAGSQASASTAMTSAPDGALGADPSAASQPRGSERPSLFSSPWFWGAVGVVAAGAIVVSIAAAGSGAESAAAVPGDFNPSVLSGEVQP